MKIIDRIVVFIKHKNLSMRAFDTSIGVGNGYTSKQAKTQASVGSDVLVRIIEQYPELSPIWLLTGQGDMIIDPTTVDDSLPDYGNNIDDMIENKIKRIVEKQFKEFSKKIENFPTLEQISHEIQKNLKKL